MSFNFKKNFQNVGGTSVVTPELIRQDSSATDTLNVDMYDNFGLTKRRGEESIEGFSAVSPKGAFTTVAGEKLVFAFGPNPLLKVIEQHLTFSIAGPNIYTIEVFQDFQGSKSLRVLENDAEVYSISLGNDQGSVPLSNIVNAINFNVPNMTATVSDDTQSAHGLQVSRITIRQVTAFNDRRILSEYLEPIAGSGISTGGGALRHSILERDGIVYFATGGSLYKYDGVSYYQASLPKPNLSFVDFGTDATASSSPADGQYRYRVLYEHTDAQGNIIQSSISDEFVISTNGTNRPKINVSSAILVGYGTGITATIVRTKEVGSGGGSIYFVVASGVALDTDYFDNTSDANLVEDFLLPPFELTASTNGKYIDIWRNSIVMTGFIDDPDKVLFEDVQYTEGFSVSNSFLTSSRIGGENSGIMAQDNAMYVFKEDSIFIVSGDLNTSQFQVDKITEEGIGAVANDSIIESQGRIWFMSKEGVYSISTDGLKGESSELTPIFEKEYTTEQLRNCVAFNNTLENKLYFNIVSPFQTNTTLVDNKTYVFNLNVQKWFIWDVIDFSGGISIKGRDIWFLGDFSFSGANIASYKRFSRTFTNLDYADRGEPIITVFKSFWDTLGEPSVQKKFVRLKLYSIDNQRQRFESPEFIVDVQTEHDYKYDQKVSGASLRFFQNNSDGTTTPVNNRRLRLLPRKCRALRYVITHNRLNENMLISGVEFEVAYEHSNYMRQR